MKLLTCLRLFSAAAGAIAPGAAAADAPLPFKEEFDDNRHGWTEIGDHDAYLSRIEGGKLVYENTSPDHNIWRVPTLPLALPERRDLEVRVRLKLVSGPSEKTYGVICGQNLASQERSDFLLGESGRYLAQRIHAGGKTYDMLAPWTATNTLKRGEFNEVTIRRIGNRTFYAINDQPVVAGTEAPLMGNRFGFIVPGGSVVEVDYLHVRMLEENERDAAALASLEKAVRDHRIAVGPPLKDLVETFDDNARNWRGLTVGDQWSGVLDSGVVKGENRSQNYQMLGLAHPVNYAADYEIGMRVKITSPEAKHHVSLTWARSVVTLRARMFSISTLGAYQLWRHKDDGNYETTVGWRTTPVIKQAEFNDVRIRRLGSTTFAIVNGQPLADAVLPEEDGYFIGVQVSPGAKVEVDEFRVTYPKLSDAERTAETKTLVAALEKAHHTAAINAAYSLFVVRDQAAAAAAAAKKAREEADKHLPKISKDKLAAQDFNQRERIRKQFLLKKVGTVWASWKKPVKISDDGYTFYYFYKRIGQTDFYYEFWATGNEKLVDRSISQVHLTDSMR